MTMWDKVVPYIKIARPDHWSKNIFILPGVIIGYWLEGNNQPINWLLLLTAAVATCLIASANYTINEYVDAPYDRMHPLKKRRPTVTGLIKGKYVTIEYLLLVFVGLGLSYTINTSFLAYSVSLLVMGLLYNIPPVRLKDKKYLDVISESVNNPIRFLMGWSVVAFHTVPPSTVLLSYWFGGAFLMALKRYAEYIKIGDAKVAGMYRKSFETYSASSLLCSSFFYGLNSTFFLAIFIIKYKIELLLSFPFTLVLFAWYFALAFREDSVVQSPERLHKEWRFMLYCAFVSALSVALLFAKFDALKVLLISYCTNQVY